MVENNVNLTSVLQSYWENESKIIGLEKAVDATIKQIVNNPIDFSDETIVELKHLLLKKNELLSILRSVQKR